MSEYTIDPASYAAVHLKMGPHATPDEGMCLMEAIAFLVNERHSDNPRCVSAVLGTFGRNVNDVLPDDLRQHLKRLIPALPGTANDGRDGRRSYLALDWLVRTWLPAWLELSTHCREDAQRVRQLGPIVDLASAELAAPVVRAARQTAVAAAAAAPGAAWNNARAIARATGWDAARDAARDAAWDATGAVAGDVARAVHGVIAAAAGEDVLAPTVRAMQLSAIDLYAEMITPEAAETNRRARAVSCTGGYRSVPNRRRRRAGTKRSRTRARRARMRSSRMARP